MIESFWVYDGVTEQWLEATSETMPYVKSKDSVIPARNTIDTKAYPVVKHAGSSSPQGDISALRLNGGNLNLYFINRKNGAVIQGEGLVSGETPVLSTSSRFPGMKEERPILEIFAGSKRR